MKNFARWKDELFLLDTRGKKLANVIQLWYDLRARTPQLQLSTIFTVKQIFFTACKTLNDVFATDYSSRFPAPLILAHYISAMLSSVLYLTHLKLFLVWRAYAYCSHCLICFSLVSFHSIGLYSRSLLTFSLGDFPI